MSNYRAVRSEENVNYWNIERLRYNKFGIRTWRKIDDFVGPKANVQKHLDSLDTLPTIVYSQRSEK